MTDTQVTTEPVIQVFSLRVVGEQAPDSGFDEWHRRRLVWQAYDQGYGLIEVINKTIRATPEFYPGSGDFVEMEFRALGVKLHA